MFVKLNISVCRGEKLLSSTPELSYNCAENVLDGPSRKMEELFSFTTKTKSQLIKTFKGVIGFGNII